jgi:hypothetical protein
MLFYTSNLKSLPMATNLTLDELILQYSNNPFIDEEMTYPPVYSKGQKQKALSKLLFTANNLFNQIPLKELNSYKRRYEFK